MKHLVNVFGGVRNIKKVFANGFVTNKTNSQKGGGDKNNLAEIKNELDIFTTLLKTGHLPQQVLLNFRANASVKSSRKRTVQRVISFQKIHGFHIVLMRPLRSSLYHRYAINAIRFISNLLSHASEGRLPENPVYCHREPDENFPFGSLTEHL